MDGFMRGVGVGKDGYRTGGRAGWGLTSAGRPTEERSTPIPSHGGGSGFAQGGGGHSWVRQWDSNDTNWSCRF